MDHAITLVTALAAGFGLALVSGVVAGRLCVAARALDLPGGIATGPAAPGLVAVVATANASGDPGTGLSGPVWPRPGRPVRLAEATA